MLIANVHRSVQAPIVVSDKELEFWARVYIRLNLLHHGLTFEAFLRSTPEVKERAAQLAQIVVRPSRKTKLGRLVVQVAQEPSIGVFVAERESRAELRTTPYPLSPKEIREVSVAMRGTVRVSDGRLIEKLRHHRHPRGARRGFIKES